MNDYKTVDMGDTAGFLDIGSLATSSLSEPAEGHDGVVRPNTPWLVPAAAALLAIGSESTAIGNQLFLDESVPSATTVTYQIDLFAQVGRAVSRSEALRIARNVLFLAEEERHILAESEARFGIQWVGE